MKLTTVKKSLLLVALFSSFVLVPLSAKAKKTKSAETPAQETAEKTFSKSKKDSKAKDKKEKKAKKETVKIVASVEDEGVFQAKTIENTVGKIKYLMKGKVGSFQLYAIPESGAAIPLFAGYDEFTSSFFSLLASGKEYKLTDNTGIVIGARKNELGAQLVYVVPKVARVLVKFEQVPHEENITSEIIRVTGVITNRSKKKGVFALKNVMDTVFGEQMGPHFSSKFEKSINSERQFRKMEEVEWITSSNAKTSMQFLLHGADISSLELLSLSNKDLLALQKWEPDVIQSRTFDSVLSYNNSAVCMNWEKVTLEPEQSATFIYYIAVATDGEKCDGNVFISQLAEKIEKGEVDPKYSVKQFEDALNEIYQKIDEEKYQEAYEIVLELEKNPDNKNERLDEAKKILEEKLSASGYEIPSSEEQNSGILFDKSSIRPEQLNSSYIQNLINRIESLEESDDVDRAEVLKLNAELDAIIEMLRSM